LGGGKEQLRPITRGEHGQGFVRPPKRGLLEGTDKIRPLKKKFRLQIMRRRAAQGGKGDEKGGLPPIKGLAGTGHFKGGEYLRLSEAGAQAPSAQEQKKAGRRKEVLKKTIRGSQGNFSIVGGKGRHQPRGSGYQGCDAAA